MSDITIEEKIRKIRQDLHNFNLGSQTSLEKYLEDCRVFKYRELESPHEAYSPNQIPSGLRNSYSEEHLKYSSEYQITSELEKRNPEYTANYKEFTLSKNKKFTEKYNEKNLIEYNQSLLLSLSESRAKYIKMLAEKDERIKYLEQKVKRSESELMLCKQGRNNLEVLKSSARNLNTKADELDAERLKLAKENAQLHQKLLVFEKEFNSIAAEAYKSKEVNLKLQSDNSKVLRHNQELTKENEILYNTIKSKKRPLSRTRTISTSYSPKKSKTPKHSRKISLGEFSRKIPLSEDVRTERKGRSRSLNTHSNKVPRPQSISKLLKPDLNNPTNCKLIKDIMRLYSTESPTSLISMIKNSMQDSKSCLQYREFIQSVQKIILANSPPNTFQNPPGVQDSIKWIKRLVKEYLGLKKQIGSIVEKRILDVVKSGLNSNTYEDIPRAISKLLVENERLLQMLSRIKRSFRLASNVSIDELERAIEART